MQSRSWGSVLTDARKYVRDDTVRISTGFPTLDEYLRGGVRPGHNVFVIGRTGVGKSAVTGAIVAHTAAQGFLTCFASLEMTREEVAIRTLSAHLGWPVYRVENALKDPNPDKELMAASVALQKFVVDDSTKPGWEDLERWLQTVAAEHNEAPRVVVVDHLKLMKRYGYPRGEAERVQQLAEDAKAFAKRNNVALFVIHQVGRGVEGDASKKNHGDKPLSMESMMYGGEQDADLVLGIYRPDLRLDITPEQREAVRGYCVLQLLKNRHGEPHLDGIPLKWKRPSMQFEEVDDLPDYLGDTDNEGEAA